MSSRPAHRPPRSLGGLQHELPTLSSPVAVLVAREQSLLRTSSCASPAAAPRPPTSQLWLGLGSYLMNKVLSDTVCGLNRYVLCLDD